MTVQYWTVGDRHEQHMEWLGQVTAQQVATRRGLDRLASAMVWDLPTGYASMSRRLVSPQGTGYREVAAQRWRPVLRNAELGPRWVLGSGGPLLDAFAGQGESWLLGAVDGLVAELVPFLIADGALAGEVLRMAADPKAWWQADWDVGGLVLSRWAQLARQLASQFAVDGPPVTGDLVAVRGERGVWDALMGTAHLAQDLYPLFALELLGHRLTATFPELTSACVLKRALEGSSDPLVQLPGFAPGLLLDWWDKELTAAGVAPSLELLWWGTGALPADARLTGVVDVVVDALTTGSAVRVPSRAVSGPLPGLVKSR